MGPAFALRPLGALDLDPAATLHCEAFTPMGERAWSRREFAELLAARGVGGVMLSCNGVPAGFALMRIAADEAELLTIAVAGQHRRRGAARLLLDAVVERSRSGGARTLFLEVGEDNGPARALYASIGFDVVGRRAGYYRRGDGAAADALVMRLALR